VAEAEAEVDRGGIHARASAGLILKSHLSKVNTAANLPTILLSIFEEFEAMSPGIKS
jgi:hypothetical protein